MPPEAEEQKQPQQPKSSKMKIIIPVVVLLLLAAGGAGAYFKYFKATGEGKEPPKNVEQYIVQDVDTFIVNLSDPGGKRFLKVTMKAKLNAPVTQEEFKERTFEMKDIILTVLSAKEYDEISRPEDKNGLKQEIMASLNRALHKGQVQDIFFTEFLIQ